VGAPTRPVPVCQAPAAPPRLPRLVSQPPRRLSMKIHGPPATISRSGCASTVLARRAAKRLPASRVSAFVFCGA
jgi:hypothetical protein